MSSGEVRTASLAPSTNHQAVHATTQRPRGHPLPAACFQAVVCCCTGRSTTVGASKAGTHDRQGTRHIGRRAWLAVTSWMYDCIAARARASQPCRPAKRRWRRSTSTPPQGTRFSICRVWQHPPVRHVPSHDQLKYTATRFARLIADPGSDPPQSRSAWKDSSVGAWRYY